MSTHSDTRHNRRPKTGFGWIAVGMVAILAYFLTMEHWAHIVSWLPYALLLGCVALHLLMHRRHGGGHGGNADKGER